MLGVFPASIEGRLGVKMPTWLGEGIRNSIQLLHRVLSGSIPGSTFLILALKCTPRLQLASDFLGCKCPKGYGLSILLTTECSAPGSAWDRVCAYKWSGRKEEGRQVGWYPLLVPSFPGLYILALFAGVTRWIGFHLCPPFLELLFPLLALDFCSSDHIQTLDTLKIVGFAFSSPKNLLIRCFLPGVTKNNHDSIALLNRNYFTEQGFQRRGSSRCE